MTDHSAGKDAGTAEAILDAAEPLFGNQGFAATTIKQIGKAAGLNPALIYYYFGSKEELYRALLNRLFGALTQRGAERLATVTTPEEAIRTLLALQSETMLRSPSLPRILAREMADHGAAHAQEGIAHLSATLFARLHALIQHGQAAGSIRADVDARFAAVSTVSLIPYFHFAMPAVAILMGGGELTREQMEAYARHAADFALAALAAPGKGAD
ncbi:TetR/AcrR family transcriptional regulator [Longimicrobium sp.]|uniref:TetR/AcrR family transcriptional regulator n=1 Tax=Longimicrobium sp. TaxID=2029185 RepID=UPI003B3B7AF6